MAPGFLKLFSLRILYHSIKKPILRDHIKVTAFPPKLIRIPQGSYLYVKRVRHGVNEGKTVLRLKYSV